MATVIELNNTDAASEQLCCEGKSCLHKRSGFGTDTMTDLKSNEFRWDQVSFLHRDIANSNHFSKRVSLRLHREF